LRTTAHCIDGCTGYRIARRSVLWPDVRGNVSTVCEHRTLDCHIAVCPAGSQRTTSVPLFFCRTKLIREWKPQRHDIVFAPNEWTPRNSQTEALVSQKEQTTRHFLSIESAQYVKFQICFRLMRRFYGQLLGQLLLPYTAYVQGSICHKLVFRGREEQMNDIYDVSLFPVFSKPATRII